MLSFGNAVEEWSARKTSAISDFRYPLISDDFPDRLSPVRAMAVIVDSAYSSFSGSSYVADYQTSYKHNVYHLNDQQISYMDSENVKGISNPSVIGNDDLQQYLSCEDSIKDSHSGSGDHFSHRTKRSTTSNSSLCSPDNKISRSHVHDHSPTWIRDSENREKSNPNFSSSTCQTVSPQHTATSKENSLCSQTKDCLQELDMQTEKQFMLQKEVLDHNNVLFHFSENQQKEGRTSKSTRRSWNEFVSEKLRACKKRAGSWKPVKDASSTNYEERKSQNAEKQSISEYHKEQYKLQPQNIKDCGCHDKKDIEYKCPQEGSHQNVSSMHHNDICKLPLQSMDHKDLSYIPKAHNLRKDSTIKPIPLLFQQQEPRPCKSNLCELTSKKITKVSTPMLYYLARGSNSSLGILNTSNQDPQPYMGKESNTVNQKGHFSVSQMAEPQKPLFKIKKKRNQSQLTESIADDFNDDDAVGSLTSSTEEFFMHDYREKLKIAQKKVLRETSFKRKDLQMSLPVRLKLNPSKRPSVDHKRSHSLSSTNEGSKLLNPQISADQDYKKESEKATVLQMRGRKRLTKEQKKLCYSEPEKLDHLGVHNSTFAWKTEGLIKNQSGNHHRMKSVDKEQALSSSNVSKSELKQIQHNALVEYMERKANQRLGNVYQTSGQKALETQSSQEWKCMENELQCSDGSLAYYRSKSTGASSSYDATVPWTDKPLKMFLHRGNTHPADKTMTYAECSSENRILLPKASSISGCEKNDPSQIPFAKMALLSSELHSNNMVFKNSLEPSEEALPRYDNEVEADVHDHSKSSAVRGPSALATENQNIEAVSEQITSPDAQSMSNIQQDQLHTEPNNKGDNSQEASYFRGYGEQSQSDEAIGQEIKVNIWEKSDFAKKIMTGVTTKSPAEEKYAALVKEITSKDKTLLDILKPLPVGESAINLMKSLFHVDISVLEKYKNQTLKDKLNAEGISKSHSKTLLLLQRRSEECLDEITSKKVKLIFNISSQLEELFAQRKKLLSQISENSTHGSNIDAVVKEVCKPNEYERYNMFIGDLEKVVSLLFSLTTRLARVENALNRTDENTEAEEMQSLKERHCLLCRQREDAKDLKDNLDRREQVVIGILGKYLSQAQLEDYKRYVKLKTSFLIEQKDLDEKIKLHKEQLESLHNSIAF